MTKSSKERVKKSEQRPANEIYDDIKRGLSLLEGFLNGLLMTTSSSTKWKETIYVKKST